MTRRANNSIKPSWLLATLILAIAAIGGGYLLYHQISDPYRTLASLEVPIYLENANSLRGNIYKIEGTVLNSLVWSPTEGRLFSVEVQSGSTTDVLPVMIPSEFNHVNVQKGQRFYFKVEVDSKGILKTQDLRKS
jgi:hypothetical protein